ncbi:MAG: hypothetical protein BGO01_03480 [Armatimonadetes bacterium 55-13]|nr:hypothetical protein [Armatimonadota bacterium]OJU63013.1 MAG: hypothetical protein BGO01_03480 [Armatimonadetes bacterium 55-13]
MWLKTATTISIIFSVVFLFAFAWVVGPRPARSAPREAQIQYLRRGAIYVGVEAFALIASIAGAYMIARSARSEYMEQSRRNMEALLEATLRDHAQKQEQDEQSTE